MSQISSNRVSINVTWRQLMAMFAGSPGLEVGLPNGRIMTNVDYSRTATNRRRLGWISVRMKDGWGFGFESSKLDETVTILD